MLKINPLLIAFFLLLSAGCSEKEKPTWKFDKIIALEGVAPLGIVAEEDFLWISDTDSNRVVKTNLAGEIVHVYEELNRPMHLSKSSQGLFISEFLTDSIKVIKDEQVQLWPITVDLDGPAGVSVKENSLAIADFYHHRITLIQDDKVRYLGEEGHDKGQLYYPTDVEIVDSLIYVADAYNNRVVVFNSVGGYQQTIGQNDQINVATGITVWEKRVFVADMFGNRVLVYDLQGVLKFEISDKLDRPTDVFIRGEKMFIANYGAKNIVVYQFR